MMGFCNIHVKIACVLKNTVKFCYELYSDMLPLSCVNFKSQNFCRFITKIIISQKPRKSFGFEANFELEDNPVMEKSFCNRPSRLWDCGIE